MKRVIVIGCPGSGKSVFSAVLSQKTGLPLCHLDMLYWNPDRTTVSREVFDDRLNSVIESDQWIIDGNYSKLFYERRMEEADQIILLLFNRFSCLFRAFRRYLQYKNQTRPDMAEGCNEKFDFAFMKWILWEGRTKDAKKRYQWILAQYSNKAVLIKNQKQLTAFIRSLGAK